MPELPEVETTCIGIKPHILNKKIVNTLIQNYKLRWRINKNLKSSLKNKKITSVFRRGKYIIIQLNKGALIIHLGMSGKLCVISKRNYSSPTKHDHLEIIFSNNKVLRYTDPRKFGSILYTNKDPLEHKLLINLGVEPLSRNFTGNYLYNIAKNRRVSIKQFLMNSNIVVGIGNIYACEILFMAKTNPLLPVNKINKEQYNNIVKCTKNILKKAIKLGGTTLKDFYSADGNPGYFSQSLKVYGKKNANCINCNNQLQQIKIAGRNTMFCPSCQK